LCVAWQVRCGMLQLQLTGTCREGHLLLNIPAHTLVQPHLDTGDLCNEAHEGPAAVLQLLLQPLALARLADEGIRHGLQLRCL
jgi:hypothetical protein